MSGEAVMTAVRRGRPEQLADVLDAMTDTERRACLPALKDLRKDLRSEPWGSAARTAYPALQLAGAACHTGAAAAAAWIGAADWRWSRRAPAQALLHVLGDRETAWLADVTHRLAALPLSREVPFELVSGLVALSGCPVPTTEAYVSGWVDGLNSDRREGRSLTDRLRVEPHVVELTAALFETEDIGRVLDWFEDRSSQSWSYALATLADEGVLERKVLVDGCVSRLLRGGRPTDTRLFLKVLGRLALTRDEERERVADWAALAADGAATVAAHAQGVLGALALDGELTARSLAEVSAAVLFRPEKKLVRAQLVLLGKVLKGRTVQGDPSAADELLPVVGEAFGHTDTEVQERALKLVARHIAEVTDAARDRLAVAAEELSAGLRPRAQELLGVTPAPDAPYEEVLPPAPLPFRLAPAPETAAEVAEEVGALLASGGDMAAFERTLDALVRHAYRDREALREALAPAMSPRRRPSDSPHQYTPSSFFMDTAQDLGMVASAVMGAVPSRPSHDADALDARGRSPRTNPALRHCSNARLWEAAYRVDAEPVPFLLATPTWSSGFIDPDVLVTRLRAYDTEGARAGEADFAQALLRVDRDSPRAAGAAVDAAALGTREGDRLAAWLRSSTAALPARTVRAEGAYLLVDLGELPEIQARFPAPFHRLGRPQAEQAGNSSWYGESGTPQDHAHWLATLPGRREIVAARLLQGVSLAAVLEVRGAAAYLPALAEAEGEAGPAVHLSVLYGLAARFPEDRLAGVDALLTLAAREQLDAGALGALAARARELDGIKTTRLAESLGTAAATGAYATVFAVLRALLPSLLGSDKEAGALRGLGDLVAVAAECAERTGARGEIPGLAEVAERKGSSRLLVQARRLRLALDGPR